MKNESACFPIEPGPIDAIFFMDKVCGVQLCCPGWLRVVVRSFLGVSMSRIVVLAVVCALFLGPFGLGAVSAWAHHDGNPLSHHGDNHGNNDKHQPHQGLVACGPSACAPAVAPSGSQCRLNSQICELLLWGFVGEQALYSALSKQDPPVPRFGA